MAETSVNLERMRQHAQWLADDYSRATDEQERAKIESTLRRLHGRIVAESQRLADQSAGVNTQESPLGMIDRARLGATDNLNEQQRMLSAQGYRTRLGNDGRLQVMDPQTNQWAYADESGLSIGDVAEFTSPFLRGLGGAGGAVLGALSPMPGGAMLGGGTGEMLGGIAADALLRPEREANLGRRARTAAYDFASGAIPEMLEPAWRAGKRMIPGLASNSVSADAINAANAYQRQNITPANVASIDPSPVNRFSAATAQSLPLIGGPIITAGMDIADEDFASAIARLTDPTTAKAAGDAAIAGLRSERDTIANQRGSLFNQIEQGIGTAPVPLPNLQRSIGMMDQLKSGSRFEAQTYNNPTLERLRPAEGEAFETPYQALKRQRTKVGDQMRAASFGGGDTASSDLSRVYATLTEDMRQAAADAGLEREFDRANALWSEYSDRIARIDRDLRPEVNDPEILAKRTIDLAKSSPTALQRAKDTMTPEAWDEVGRYVLNRMARATPGQAGNRGGTEFSMQTFLTNITGLGQGTDRARALDVLFGSSGPMRENVDDLILITQNDRRMRELLNNSNTAKALGGAMAVAGPSGIVASTVTGNIPATLGTLAGLGSGSAMAYWLRRPGFAQAVRKAAQRADGREDVFQRELYRALGQVAGTGAGDSMRDFLRVER